MTSSTIQNPLVSVIIPTFNEEKNIADNLKALKKQTYTAVEVIIVDDNSTDKTVELSKKIAKEIKLPLEVLENKTHQERGVVRNQGAKKARGQYLLFIDADMNLTPKVIEECIECENHQKVSAVIIPERSVGEGFWAKCRTLEKECYIGDDTIEAARFFEKNVFWKVGGWDEKMISGEDWDLTKRIRLQTGVGRIPSVLIHREGALNPIKAAKKKLYYAKQSAKYLQQNKTTPLTIFLFIFRPAYFRNWKLLIKDPIHAIGMFALKFIELSLGVVGIFQSKLSRQS
jgi:glycosyltransferase involved in cell wall biosynthesis